MPSCTRSICPQSGRACRYAGAGPARLPQAGPNLSRIVAPCLGSNGLARTALACAVRDACRGSWRGRVARCAMMIMNLNPARFETVLNSRR